MKDPRQPPAAGGAPGSRRAAVTAETRVGLVTVASVALLGAPAGVLWALLSPQLDLRAAINGSESAFRVLISDDVGFLALSALVGIATGLVAWVLGRRRGIGALLGLTIGGLAAAAVAARVGHLVRLPDLLGQLRSGVPAEAVRLVEFRLRARGLLVVLPLAAVLTFLALTTRLPRAEEPETSTEGWPYAAPPERAR